MAGFGNRGPDTAGCFYIEIPALVINSFNTVFIAIGWSLGHGKEISNLNMGVIPVKLSLPAICTY